MKKIWSAVFGLALALGVVPAAHAQVFTPTFQSPYPSNDVGVYLTDYGDLAVEGILRRDQLGLRLGVADGTLLAGVDFRNPLSVNAAPLALALTLGAQGAFGDGAEVFGGQVGISVGGRIASPGLVVVPYIHPRFAVFSGDGNNSEVLADVGVDVEFNRNLALRFGANLAGTGGDFGIGLAFKR